MEGASVISTSVFVAFVVPPELEGLVPGMLGIVPDALLEVLGFRGVAGRPRSVFKSCVNRELLDMMIQNLVMI